MSKIVKLNLEKLHDSLNKIESKDNIISKLVRRAGILLDCIKNADELIENYSKKVKALEEKIMKLEERKTPYVNELFEIFSNLEIEDDFIKEL